MKSKVKRYFFATNSSSITQHEDGLRNVRQILAGAHEIPLLNDGVGEDARVEEMLRALWIALRQTGIAAREVLFGRQKNDSQLMQMRCQLVS
jgi:hypothetical protein